MFSLNCKGKLLLLNKPAVMGIVNVTPDSFFSGSRFPSTDAVVSQAGTMLQQGAAIIDIGGQSTRPGNEQITEEEELQRVIPAVEAVSKNFSSAIISIDTFYAKVARYAVAAGASMINDVSAGTLDEALIPAVAELKVPYVLMHMKGVPQTMQQKPVYENVVLEVFDYLNFKTAALHQLGIKDIIVDIGFGFGKTFSHNFELLKGLSYFTQLQKPVLVGLSRKGTIYKTLGVTAEEALNGTTVANTLALVNGASIIRVHDVKEAVEAIKLIEAYRMA